MSRPPPLSSTMPTRPNNPVRLMIVDDSKIVRQVLARLLSEKPDIEIAASVGNGQAALDALDQHHIDVVLLDIEMPVIDGMTALPLLLEKKPGIKIIMLSTLTMKNAEIGLHALEIGAVDFVAKPTAAQQMASDPFFMDALAGTIKDLGTEVWASPPSLTEDATIRETTPLRNQSETSPTLTQKPFMLRKPSTERPEIIAIGSSTGGPTALLALFADIRKGGGLTQPVVITQHMPPMLTTALAARIEAVVDVPSKEGEDGEILQDGHIYVAPGGFHMLIERNGPDALIRISDAPPENLCRPAIDPMLRSVASVYGPRALTVVLTGTGTDGVKGATDVADGGGTVIAQDEGTSLVWKMPGAVAHSGACAAVLPLSEIGPYLLRTAGQR